MSGYPAQYAGYSQQQQQPYAQQQYGQQQQQTYGQYAGGYGQQQQQPQQASYGQMTSPTAQYGRGQLPPLQPQQYGVAANTYGQQLPSSPGKSQVMPQPQQYGQQMGVQMQPQQQMMQQQMVQQQQQMQRPGMSAAPGQWSSGLFGCLDDCYICCVGTYQTPVQYGENYRKLNGDGFCGACLLYYFCYCVACCFANGNREKLRSKYNLPEEPCSDCCVHCWCSPCAICQEARELRKREGWQTWAD